MVKGVEMIIENLILGAIFGLFFIIYAGFLHIIKMKELKKLKDKEEEMTLRLMKILNKIHKEVKNGDFKK